METHLNSLMLSIQNGAKYNDLVKIYNYELILQAIAKEFLLDKNPLDRPDLRSISKEIESPYSVIMDSFNLVNK